MDWSGLDMKRSFAPSPPRPAAPRRPGTAGLLSYGLDWLAARPPFARGPRDAPRRVSPPRLLRRGGPHGVQSSAGVALRTLLDGQRRQLDVRLVEEFLPLSAPFESM